MINKIKAFIEKLNFRRTVSLTWSVSKPLAITTLLFLVIENMLWLGSVYMLKRLVDVVAKAGHKERLDELMNIVILTGVISVAYACIKSLSGYFSERHATKVNHFIDREIHRHTLLLDYSFYEDPEYLNILKRAREAGADKPYSVVSSLFDIIKNGIMMVSVGYILISIDWMLLPLLVVFVFPILIGRILFSNKGFQLYIENTALDREAHYLSSLITGETFAKETRTFLLGDFLITKYRLIKDKLVNQQFALSRRRTINELFTTGVGTTAFFGVTAYIVFGTLSGRTTVGDIAMFLVIFPQSYGIMQSLVAAITRLYHNNMYAAHIFELFSLQPKVENRLSSASIVANKQSGELLVQNVSFKYPSGDEPALRNVTLRVPAGKIVALVGMNGAGKTTLIKLLCKLYEPTEGSILFGGNDIRQYSASQYRKQISVVFQDFVRYNLTVNENISFGDISREVCEEAIQKAAVSAGADRFIVKFPNQYNTVLGRLFDNGHEISIGQWQKIAIARAFYSDSSLIILDEATSALDAIAEAELFKSFRSGIGQRSALVISHRLSTIKHADYIYVLSDKEIIEAGTHEELLTINGKYASLYESNRA